MPWSAAAAIGGAIISGSMASDAAGDAADAQSRSSAASIAEQRRQYDQTRSDQLPFMQTGQAANQKLAYLLGLNTQSNANLGTNSNTGSYYDPNQPMSRQEFMNWWNNPTGPALQHALATGWDPVSKSGESADDWYNRVKDVYSTGTYANPIAAREEFGLPTVASGTAPPNPQNDPSYGSLLRNFSQSDLEADPVYQSGLQFGLDQGTGAINARALAGGNYDSGATLKALTRYANDYGSTKANESYNRYNTNNTNIYNRLAGISGAGQTATNQVGASGTNMANQVSNAYTDQGNARAAGIVGGSNAWGDAISGIGSNANNYNKWLKGISTGSSSPDWTTSGYGVDGAYSDF